MTDRLHSTWRSPCGTYEVAVSLASFQAMTRLARKHFPNEVGTALAGRYSDDGHNAIVSDLAPLTADSRGTRLTFDRGARGLFEFFRGLFRASSGQVHYVGEWHSHPRGAPHPSGTDDSNMFAIADAPKALCPECILVILATDKQRHAIGLFIYSRTRGRVALVQVDEVPT